MFAKTIIDSDAFLDMPLSTQALYFHLSMRADDEGFINNPKKIQRMIGASEDDLKVLIAKNFIIPFESGIVVIKHWRIHNYIRGDRVKNTVYVEERQLLDTKENGAYTIMSDICQADVSQVTDKCPSSGSIGKYSIGKVNINNNIYSANFESFWSAYPRKKEKQRAYKCFNARIKDGFSEAELTQAAEKYAEECEKEHREDKYIKLPATFLSANTPFIDYLSSQKSSPVSGPMEYEIDNDHTHPQIPPYYGFPKEWFDGDTPIRERFTPMKQIQNFSVGVTDEVIYSIDELWQKYELRKEAYENGQF